MTHRRILQLDPTHPITHQAVADAHWMHHHVMSGFADQLPDYDFFTGTDNGHADHRAALNILYAVTLRPNREVWVMVQSDTAGDWTDTELAPALVAQNQDRLWTPPTVDVVRYQITVTPQRKHKGRQVCIVGADNQIAWWQRQAERAGLDVVSHRVDVLGSERAVSRVKSSRNGSRASFAFDSVTFGGFATVVDRELFERACVKGIGRSRAYGCGLLLTMRPPHL